MRRSYHRTLQERDPWCEPKRMRPRMHRYALHQSWVRYFRQYPESFTAKQRQQ